MPNASDLAVLCRLEQLETTSKDCEQLMPQGLEPLQARVEELAKELATLEAGIVEAEAKNELYKLLEIRTRWGCRTRRGVTVKWC